MHKTREEKIDPKGNAKKVIVWSFPIAGVQTQVFRIELTHMFDQKSTNLVRVQINGLKHPNTTVPKTCMYVGKETKDPTLYALSKRLLDTFEDMAKACVSFSPEIQDDIKRGLVIDKKYDNGTNGASFRLDNWGWNEPRRFSSADAIKFFSELEIKIDRAVPEIELSIAESAEKRPALMQGRDPVPPEMHYEMARQAILDGYVPGNSDRASPAQGKTL